MSTTAISNMNSAAASAFSGRTPIPMAASSSNDDSSSDTSGTAMVSANDFLTLLVTEMKNQDPTATQDPNEYVNQLVQVNSLQQLIGINEVLTNSLGDPSSTSDSTTPTKQIQNAAANQTPIATGAVVTSGIASAGSSSLAHRASGNLGIPVASPSAQGVARALSGSHAAYKSAAADILR